MHGTGGVGKIAVVLAKAGGQAAFQLAKRAIAQVWARVHAMKSCLAMEAVEAGTGARFNAYLNEAVSGAGGKALGAHANLRETALDVLESVMSKEGFDRSKFNFKAIVDHMMWRPKCKAMLANPASRAVLFDRLAVLGKLIGDDVEGKFMKNFLDFAEDRLVVLDAHGNFEKEWMEDWMRAFKGNPSEFQPPIAPLESLTEQQRGFLKQVLDDPDPGDFWKLDDPVWTNGAEPPFPHNYWTRGIIAEIDLYHQSYKAAGYQHLPIAQAVDYTSATMAVQVKTVKNPATAMVRMEKAIDDLIQAVPEGQLRLHVLVKPGQDPDPLREHLLTYLTNTFPQHRPRFDIQIVNYDAVP